MNLEQSRKCTSAQLVMAQEEVIGLPLRHQLASKCVQHHQRHNRQCSHEVKDTQPSQLLAATFVDIGHIHEGSAQEGNNAEVEKDVNIVHPWRSPWHQASRKTRGKKQDDLDRVDCHQWTWYHHRDCKQEAADQGKGNIVVSFSVEAKEEEAEGVQEILITNLNFGWKQPHHSADYRQQGRRHEESHSRQYNHDGMGFILPTLYALILSHCPFAIGMCLTLKRSCHCGDDRYVENGSHRPNCSHQCRSILFELTFVEHEHQEAMAEQENSDGDEDYQ
mmetsp:Transcript_18178/g.42506  ORF Transcript_18178/g.42506 Transcript_18178/m.42506 type:complete len:277 (-) Transcript_18178:213-1043(-)